MYKGIMLRNLVLCIALVLGCSTLDVQAGERPHDAASKPVIRLLGTWRSTHEKIIFRADDMIVYRGKRHYYAVANGFIQISGRYAVRNLPYKLFDGKLTITDEGKEVVYTRVR